MRYWPVLIAGYECQSLILQASSITKITNRHILYNIFYKYKEFFNTFSFVSLLLGCTYLFIVIIYIFSY